MYLKLDQHNFYLKWWTCLSGLWTKDEASAVNDELSGWARIPSLKRSKQCMSCRRHRLLVTSLEGARILCQSPDSTKWVKVHGLLLVSFHSSPFPHQTRRQLQTCRRQCLSPGMEDDQPGTSIIWMTASLQTFAVARPWCWPWQWCNVGLAELAEMRRPPGDFCRCQIHSNHILLNLPPFTHTLESMPGACKLASSLKLSAGFKYLQKGRVSTECLACGTRLQTQQRFPSQPV